MSGLQNFDQAINATNSALNSAGSAQNEFETAMGGLTKKLEGLKGQFQELVWGDGGLNKFLKGLTDLGTGILKFLNDADAINVILMATVVILGVNLIPKLILFCTKLIKTTAETRSLSAGLKAVGISASVAQIALVGLTLVVSAVVMAWNAYKTSQEEARNSVLESLSAFESQNESISQSIQNIKNESATKESLISTISSLNKSYDKEKASLDDINTLRQEAIDLLYEEARAKAQETMRKTSLEYEKQKGFLEKETTPYGLVGEIAEIEIKYGIIGTPEEKLKIAGEHIDAYNEKIDNLSGTEKKQLSLLSEYYKVLDDKVSYATSVVDGYENAQSIANSTQEEWIKGIQQATGEQEEQTSSTEKAKVELLDYEQTLKSLDATLSILSGTTISGLADAFNLLKDAQEEINNTGKLSIDNYEELMSLGAKYQTILFDENGQLRLNEESIQAVYNAKIDEMAITSARNMIDLANTLSSEGQSFAELANNIGSATVAGWEQIAVMMAELELSDKDSKALQVRIDGIKQWAEQAKKNVGTYSQTTKAINEQKEALDKLKDEYKAVTEYIEDQLDSEISRIEDAKSTELDRIDAVIDALKKKRNEEEDYWDNRISALEEQNKAIEKQIELEKLQENLALARNKKVMVMGANGWEIREDEQAVAQAEQDIADYTHKQQAQTEIDILNKLKETALANYDSQIQAQEEFRARQESAFDAQIAILEGYKAEYNDMVNAYEEEQNRLLALQVLGTDFENQTWQTRLSNLQSYVNRYNSLQASLGGSVANTSSGGEDTVKIPPSTPTTVMVTSAISGGTRMMMAYASGVTSVPDDGIAITGDNPSNRELVIGGKLNGTATKLTSGTGVVNAKSTNTLAGILNNLGGLGNIGQTVSNATKSVQNYFNITANVQDGEGLVDYLQNFSASMTQKTFS